MEIRIKILDFKESETYVDDYCDVITTVPVITYEYENTKCILRGKKDQQKGDLIPLVKAQVCFNVWFENHELENFNDIGLSSPIVYNWEEDINVSVESIFDFVSNCEHQKCYKDVMEKLQFLAEDEVDVTIIDEDNEEDDKIFFKFYDYDIVEIKEFIKKVEKIGIAHIPDGEGGYDVIMKGNNCTFINNVEFDGNVEEAVISTISDDSFKLNLDELKKYLLKLQEDNEKNYDKLERENLN